jgi:hypothetical protein
MSQKEVIQPTFTPDKEDVKSLTAWFEKYQSHVLKNELDEMAAMAIFPLIVVTDDSNGNCVSQSWDVATFKQVMDLAAQGVDLSTVTIENNRNPIFLSKNLAIVISDAITTIAGQPQQSRYADIMVKQDGAWKYKSMIQSGWGDMLKQYFGA